MKSIYEKNLKRLKKLKVGNIKNSIKNDIINKYPEERFQFSMGIDEAIIGVCPYQSKIVYSTKKCLDILLKDMRDEDAYEYFYYHIVGNDTQEGKYIFVDDLFE